MTRLTCFQISANAPAIVPARAERAWMDASDERFAYRCLPLTIANSSGWELLAPMAITAEWNGGPDVEDVTIAGGSGDEVGGFAQSHFGSGVLTLQTGYLFRTDPAVGLSVRGSPNEPKDGLCALEGVVETDWLSFTFTMNWLFTRPGRIAFAAGEPFCFIAPLAYRAIEAIRPEIVPLASDPTLEAAYADYKGRRLDFNERLLNAEPEATQQAWQRWYFRGETPEGAAGSPNHRTRIRAAAPLRSPSLDTPESRE